MENPSPRREKKNMVIKELIDKRERFALNILHGLCTKMGVDALKTFSSMENVASQGELMVGMGIISPEEKVMIGN